MSKRKYDSEDTKKRLLRAGMDVFSRDGYDAATTRKIAEVAEVNEALIHRYFKTKSGLFFAILKSFYQQMSVCPSYPISETLEKEIGNFLQFRANFYQKHKKFIKLGINRAILDKEVMNEFKQLGRHMPTLVERFEKFRAEGKIRDDLDFEKVSFLIGGIAFAFGMFKDVLFKFDPKFIEEVLPVAVRILSDGLAPRK
jgi:AcrR family transcriptional regulator